MALVVFGFLEWIRAVTVGGYATDAVDRCIYSNNVLLAKCFSMFGFILAVEIIFGEFWDRLLSKVRFPTRVEAGGVASLDLRK